MNQSDGAKIAATLTVLYPNSKLADGAEAGYAMALADIPYEVVNALMPQIMDAHPTFCPGPAELRAFVTSITNPPPSWEQGWQEVMSQVRSVGNWGMPGLKDPAAAEAVRSLGWSTFCNAPDPKFGGDARELSFLQSRFREVYETASIRQANADTLDRLPEGARLALAGGGA